MIIFHGDNQIASRQAFLDMKAGKIRSGSQIVEFDGNNLSLADMVTASNTVSLLGTNNSIFIDNLFSRRTGNEKKLITGYLKVHPRDDIVIWESKDQSQQLKGFSPATVRKFDLPRELFRFLETFSLDYLDTAIKNSSPEQLLALMGIQIHKLIMVRSGISDFPSWQLEKLKRQSSAYSLSGLVAMNRQLLSIDYAQKTSSRPYDLQTALELWLVSL